MLSIEEMAKRSTFSHEDLERACREARAKRRLTEEEIRHIIAEGEGVQLISTGVPLTERDKEIMAADLRGDLGPYEADYLLLKEIISDPEEFKNAWNSFVRNNHLKLGPGPWDELKK